MANVLIVDDETDCLNPAKTLLSMHGFDVETATDGHAAIELGRRFVPDVLLVDRMLGGDMDGMQVAEKLQKIIPDLQVILVTGYATVDVEERAAQTPKLQCLTKPVVPGELVQAVQRAAGVGQELS